MNFTQGGLSSGKRRECASNCAYALGAASAIEGKPWGIPLDRVYVGNETAMGNMDRLQESEWYGDIVTLLRQGRGGVEPQKWSAERYRNTVRKSLRYRCVQGALYYLEIDESMAACILAEDVPRCIESSSACPTYPSRQVLPKMVRIYIEQGYSISNVGLFCETLNTYDDDLAGAQAAISSSSTAAQPSTTMRTNDPATNRHPTSTASDAEDVSQSGHDESS
ncbi:hypothetical protein CONLIGDRAFT_646616 [Coniochaeta ligniaria NRRL 30616]|uniref:Uncharacterized protein n=1 Tax=Coniochaeta ligniaria NRRL 30616 TaxID=1408157 RepID=A0A1J7IG59_9PEZI|nr:hypothetical protein CONLIGDRAFT_646616 [Coniochaeta ligniaria NRRL 30616]